MPLSIFWRIAWKRPAYPASWYPFCASRQLTNKLFSQRILGQQLVAIWVGRSVHLDPAYCPDSSLCPVAGISGHGAARIRIFLQRARAVVSAAPMAESLLSRNPAALLNRVYHTLRGQGLGFLHDLAYGPGSPLDFQLKLPKHILMITITGFPLRKYLSNGMARRCHGRLASLGPNDGTLVLADVCALPGLIYPVWGSHHYLRPEKDVSQLVLAFLQYLDEESHWRLCKPS